MSLTYNYLAIKISVLITYCGCSACTQAVWNSPAVDAAGSFTCGARITWLQSPEGGSLSEYNACQRVAGEEFSNGPCGPYCDPTKCWVTCGDMVVVDAAVQNINITWTFLIRVTNFMFIFSQRSIVAITKAHFNSWSISTIASSTNMQHSLGQHVGYWVIVVTIYSIKFWELVAQHKEWLHLQLSWPCLHHISFS